MSTAHLTSSMMDYIVVSRCLFFLHFRTFCPFLEIFGKRDGRILAKRGLNLKNM